MKKVNEFEETLDLISKETFMSDAICKFGEEKMRKVFTRAWEQGHSEGENGIKNSLRDFIDILNC